MLTIIGKIREKASFFLKVFFCGSDYPKAFVVCLEDLGKIAAIALYEASDVFLTFAAFQGYDLWGRMLGSSLSNVPLSLYLAVFAHISVGSPLAIFLFTTSASFKLLLDLLPTNQTPFNSFRTVCLAELLLCLFFRIYLFLLS